jgi:hypothetical protein
VALDLSGRWRGPSRRVRIVTSMRIYWDRIQVGTLAREELAPIPVALESAELRERGFSREASPDGREPVGYDYAQVDGRVPWKLVPGRYTRTGGVRELLERTDDAYVISRTGDEIALAFDARGLPAPAAGRRRTFLLYSDGFSKEMDLHSATPDAMGPLPYHGMPRYPYGPPDEFPWTPERRALYERYTTRIVRERLPSLEAPTLAR